MARSCERTDLNFTIAACDFADASGVQSLSTLLNRSDVKRLASRPFCRAQKRGFVTSGGPLTRRADGATARVEAAAAVLRRALLPKRRSKWMRSTAKTSS
jgi:hypothetical protein